MEPGSRRVARTAPAFAHSSSARADSSRRTAERSHHAWPAAAGARCSVCTHTPGRSMKTLAWLRRAGAMLVMIAAVARIAPAQSAPSAADSAGIREAALQYIEGGYGGHASPKERETPPARAT